MICPARHEFDRSSGGRKRFGHPNVCHAKWKILPWRNVNLLIFIYIYIFIDLLIYSFSKNILYGYRRINKYKSSKMTSLKIRESDWQLSGNIMTFTNGDFPAPRLITGIYNGLHFSDEFKDRRWHLVASLYSQMAMALFRKMGSFGTSANVPFLCWHRHTGTVFRRGGIGVP